MKLNKNNITYLAKHIFPIYFRDESSYTLSFICKKEPAGLMRFVEQHFIFHRNARMPFHRKKNAISVS